MYKLPKNIELNWNNMGIIQKRIYKSFIASSFISSILIINLLL